MPFTRNSQLATRNFPPGFTLIELMVVIGVILILMGLFFAGAKIVTAQAKTRDTKTALETCKTMFENYRQATHLTRVPPGLQNDGFWTTTTFSWYTSQELAPTGILTSPPPTTAQIVMDTAQVMYALESMPENRTIITNLPPSKIVNVTIPINSGGIGSQTTTVSVSLVLDGWGNPILFVPGGGLGIYTPSGNELVWLDGANQGIITSAGTITGSSTPYNLTSYSPATPGIQLPNQPFFFSAGPDGSINNSHPNPSNPSDNSNSTDDNVYSFNN